MERVNNVFQGSEPQFLPKVPGTISCDSYDFHLLVTWASPITSWEIDGETVETVPDFISGGSRITADVD